MSAPIHPKRRFIFAYWTTGMVSLNYLFLRLLRPFVSQNAHRKMTTRFHIKNARRLGRCIEKLQGLYIKVGQLFSIMVNFLPREFRQELEGLQNSVPPRGYEEIRERLQEEFGKDPDVLFRTFDHIAIASASLGQVHRATLQDGTDVAVKVRYPGIEVIVESDLVTLRKIVGFLERIFPKHGLTTVYDEIEQMVLEELDFTREAESLLRISGNFAGEGELQFPVLYPEFCTGRVLTTSFVEGGKVTRAVAQKSRAERRGIAEKIVHSYCVQIFHHGVYHADPHPGNILLTPSGEIVLLDFGATAELSTTMREGIVDLLRGVLSKNTDRIQDALRKMGFLNRSASPDILEQIIGVLHERLQTYIHVESMNLKDIQLDPQVLFDTLTELRRMDVGVSEMGHFFHIPSEWILLERTLLLLTGLCTELDDELQPMEILKPYLEGMLADRGEDWADLAIHTAQDVGLHYLSLPMDIKKFLRRASMGRLEIRTPAVRSAADRVYTASRQLMWTGFTIATGVLSSMFYLNQELELARYLFYGSCGFGTILILSMVKDALRPKR